jgi:tubulin polyglutamylase TTLL1
VYLSSLGFARFTNVRYSSEVAQLDNQFVHLTNVAVQKEGGSAYNTSHGNKWPLQDLRLYLEASRGHEATAQLFADMQALVVHTLKAVQPVGGDRLLGHTVWHTYIMTVCLASCCRCCELHSPVESS